MKSSNPNKLTPRQSAEKALRPIALATTLLVGGGALAACAPTEAKPTPSATAPAPEATPTETEKPSNRYEGYDFERTDPLPESLVELENMSPAEFAKQPKSEQLRWASWAAQYKDEFVAKYHSVTGDSYDAPYELSADSDVLVALEDVSYTDRIAANFGSGDLSNEIPEFNGQLDRNMIEKLMIAHVASDEYSRWRIDEFMNSVGQDGKAINVVAQARAGLYDYRQNAEKSSDFTANPDQIIVDGVAYNGWRVQYTTEQNSRADFTVAIVPYTNYLNEQDYTTVTK